MDETTKAALVVLLGGGGTAALVQAVKAALVLPSRALPLLAIGCGLGLSVAVGALTGEPLGPYALVGLATGLTASGAYSQAKTARKG